MVVFVIGMHVHRWRRVRTWVPVARAMLAMLAELNADPESGFLGSERLRAGRTFVQLQYWRSPEDLGRFAHDPKRTHVPAWAAFNRAAAGSGDVGVFHETYRVAADGVESLYANMPDYGLLRMYGARARSDLRRNRTHRRMESGEADYVEISRWRRRPDRASWTPRSPS